jgi:hypothetical protein
MEILGLSSQWHADGTFKISPHLFAQNYLIHGWLNNEMWPCVTVLMPDRQKKTYKKMIKELKQATTVKLQPKKILSDFEAGAMNAFAEEFPGVTIKGCNFHMAQCVWRKIQQLGLATAYQNDSELRKWLELFKGLSFVPLTLLDSAFSLIISKKPFFDQNEKIDLFINYYRTTWLNESSIFPPNILNHFDTIGPRTKNHVEGFNFKLNTTHFATTPTYSN